MKSFIVALVGIMVAVVSGIAAAQDSVIHLATFASIFGAPNGWRLDPGGKLTKDVVATDFSMRVLGDAA